MSNSGGKTTLPDNGNVQTLLVANGDTRRFKGLVAWLTVVTALLLITATATGLSLWCTKEDLVRLFRGESQPNFCDGNHTDTHNDRLPLQEVTKIAEMYTQITVLSAEIDALKQQMSGVVLKNEGVSATLARMNATETWMIDQYSAQHDEIKLLAMNVSAIHDKSNTTAAVVFALMEQNEALQHNLSAIDVKLDRTMQQRSEQQSKLESLERENFRIDAKVNQTSLMLSALVTQNEGVSATLAKMNATIKLLEMSLADIHDKLAVTNSANSSYQYCKETAIPTLFALLAMLTIFTAS